MLKGISFHGEPTSRRCSLGGYLWKMKNNIKTQKFYVPKWTKRWFSIEGTTLKWYASEHTAEASGNINIKHITRVGRVKAGENGVHSFTVECAERTLLLRAESKRILEMWCRAIQMHTDIAKGGDGTSIVAPSNLNKVKTGESEEVENLTTDSIADGKGRHHKKTDMDIDMDMHEKESKRSINSDEESVDSLDGENSHHYQAGLRHEFQFNGDSTAQAKHDGHGESGSGRRGSGSRSRSSKQQPQHSSEKEHHDGHGKRQFRISSLLTGKRAKIYV